MSIAADVSEPPVECAPTPPWGTWRQNKTDLLELTLPLPSGARANTVSVAIASQALRATHDGRDLISGQLRHMVLPDECEWQLDGGALVITLRKLAEGWWDRVVEQDEPMDVRVLDQQSGPSLAQMEEHQRESLRDHIGRLLGDEQGHPG